MKIGVDYYNTITRLPELFKLINSILAVKECEIIIVTAVAKKEHDPEGKLYRARVEKDLQEKNIYYDQIIVVEFTEPKEVPYLKLEVCQKYDIEYFFDDRNDVCTLLQESGIIAAKV